MYTTLITNGRIVDGSGNPWRYGDVALADDRVAAIAPPGSIDPDIAETDFIGDIDGDGFGDVAWHVRGQAAHILFGHAERLG